MFRKFHFKFFVFMCFFAYGKSVPIDYCLQPLDKSDCGLKPTPVFSYYKPGSRCEIEFWRGCPTFNKFPDEYLCLHHCIGKLYDRSVDNDIAAVDVVNPKIKDEEYDECKLPMKEGDCGGPEEYKYTFVDYLCMRVVWRGCPSHNLFDDEASCMQNCSQSATKPQNKDFKDKLDDLPLEDIKAVNEVLDNVMTDTTKPIQLKLMHKLPIEKTTVPESVEIANENTEAYTQAPTPASEPVAAETATYTEPAIAAVPTQVPAEPTEVPTAPTTEVPTAPTTEVPTAPTTEVPTAPTDAVITTDTMPEAQTTEAPSTAEPFETTARSAEKPLQTTPENSGSVDEVVVT